MCTSKEQYVPIVHLKPISFQTAEACSHLIVNKILARHLAQNSFQPYESSDRTGVHI